MSTIFHEIVLPRRRSRPANVVTLPGSPLRALDGMLISELSVFECEVEIVKRRILGAPPLFADFERN